LIVGWCGRFLFFVVPHQFSQDIGEWPQNQILIPDWTYFHCPGTTLVSGQEKRKMEKPEKIALQLIIQSPTISQQSTDACWNMVDFLLPVLAGVLLVLLACLWRRSSSSSSSSSSKAPPQVHIR